MCWGLEAELGAHFLGPLWWHHWVWAQDSGLPQLRLQSFLPTHELCGPRQTLTLFKPWIPRKDTSSPFLRALFWEGQYTGKHPHTEAGVCGGPDSGGHCFYHPRHRPRQQQTNKRKLTAHPGLRAWDQQPVYFWYRLTALRAHCRPGMQQGASHRLLPKTVRESQGQPRTPKCYFSCKGASTSRPHTLDAASGHGHQRALGFGLHKGETPQTSEVLKVPHSEGAWWTPSPGLPEPHREHSPLTPPPLPSSDFHFLTTSLPALGPTAGLACCTYAPSFSGRDGKGWREWNGGISSLSSELTRTSTGVSEKEELNWSMSARCS